MTLAPMRVVPPPIKQLPLRVLIALLEERRAAVRADERLAVGCLAELLEQALPYLRAYERLEAPRVL